MLFPEEIPCTDKILSLHQLILAVHGFFRDKSDEREEVILFSTRTRFTTPFDVFLLHFILLVISRYAIIKVITIFCRNPWNSA